MNANPNPIALPGTITILRQITEPSVRKYYVNETEPHTDDALLNYVGANVYLWGRVDRFGDQICVVRYTS